MTRHLHVTCAIIERDGRVLAAQRGGGGSMAFKWEFPGGKIRPGESPEACLHRELMEEMGLRIDVKRPLDPAPHRYPLFDVTLYPFVCTIAAGEPVLNAHRAVVWLPPGELPSLDWAEADRPVIAAYLETLRGERPERPVRLSSAGKIDQEET
ncbi:MAG: (deoxy)nucleoside triphosphate pyrophosphohydrolase [Syntrophales bacterium]|nr:(deoxy)nucleoside triphosphate pyrophosphohydrolase [Syntrophales bacterium]